MLQAGAGRRHLSRQAIRGLALPLAAMIAVAPGQSDAFTVGITAGTRSLYLQVGTGTVSGGNFNAGGTPANNGTINNVSVTVPAASVGSSVAQPMATNSTVVNSPWDGYAFCTSPATTGQVYVGGFYRVPGSTEAAATLSVSTTSPNLINTNGDTLSFASVAWTSSGNGDTTPTIPSGTFLASGGSQPLLSVNRNTWFESCLAFRYLNTQVVAAGSYSGRATYTLVSP